MIFLKGDVIFPEQRNFSEALSLCRKMRGRISIVRSMQMQEDFVREFQKYPGCRQDAYGNRIWKKSMNRDKAWSYGQSSLLVCRRKSLDSLGWVSFMAVIQSSCMLKKLKYCIITRNYLTTQARSGLGTSTSTTRATSPTCIPAGQCPRTERTIRGTMENPTDTFMKIARLFGHSGIRKSLIHYEAKISEDLDESPNCSVQSN